MAGPLVSRRTSFISTARLVLVVLATTAIIFPRLYDGALNSIWTFLRRTKVYRWSTFETLWTVFWYAAIEVSITTVFIRHPEWRFQKDKATRTKPRGMRRPSRRMGEIATYIAPLLAMDMTMIKKFAGVPLEDILVSGGYEYEDYRSPLHDSGSRLPAKTFLIPTLHNFSTNSPLQLSRALPMAAPSSRRLAAELVLSFFIYDFLFFLFHLGLHVLPGLRRWHAPHHSHDAQLNPQVTNQLTVIERLGLVLLANFSLNIIGAHVLTRTLFVPVFVWLLVEIHSGMDLPWAYDKLLPQGWAGGASKHMRHHQTSEGGFEPFFSWWDTALDKATRKIRAERAL